MKWFKYGMEKGLMGYNNGNEKNNKLSFFENTKDNLHSRNNNSSNSISSNGNENRGRDRTRQERQSKRTSRPINENGTQETRRRIRRSDSEVGERIEKKIIKENHEFTLEEVFNSISDEILIQLIRDNFDPFKKIKITKTKVIKNTFKEDSYFDVVNEPKKQPRKKIIKSRKSIPPSMRYDKEFNKYIENKREGDCIIVLAFYFKIYKKYCNEEDPQWESVPTIQAIATIKKMVNQLCNSEDKSKFYEELIYFTKTIVSLWFKRLESGETFPNMRPTIDTLYNVNNKLHFWSNRKQYYRSWKE